MKTSKTISESIDMLCASFKSKCNSQYVTNLRNYMVYDLRLHADEIEVICKVLPERCRTFPTRMDVKKVSDEIKKNANKVKTQHGQSLIADSLKSQGELIGVPTLIEAVCIMIEQGRTGSEVFQKRLSALSLSEEEAWRVYEDRCNGKLHPWIIKYKEERGL